MYAWILSLLVSLGAASSHSDSIARAIAVASSQEPLFSGPDGAKRTAALLVSLAWYESRFDPWARGDKGKSLGLYQIQTTTAGEEEHILFDPLRSSFVALRLIRASFAACAHLPQEERLSWYASGSCERGRRESRHRFALAKHL